MLYASPELRSAKGLANKARLEQFQGRLIMPVQHIAEAYWSTRWGKAMRDELKKQALRQVSLLQRSGALPEWTPMA